MFKIYTRTINIDHFLAAVRREWRGANLIFKIGQ